MSTTEVGARMADKGLDPNHFKRTPKELDVQTIDFDLAQALLCTSMLLSTKSVDLSQGDRACLAVTQLMDGIAVAADRA